MLEQTTVLALAAQHHVRLMDETVCGVGAHFIRFDIKAPSLGGQRNSMLDSIKMLAHGPAETVCHKVRLT